MKETADKATKLLREYTTMMNVVARSEQEKLVYMVDGYFDAPTESALVLFSENNFPEVDYTIQFIDKRITP